MKARKFLLVLTALLVAIGLNACDTSTADGETQTQIMELQNELVKLKNLQEEQLSNLRSELETVQAELESTQDELAAARIALQEAQADAAAQEQACISPPDDPYACADPTNQKVVFWHPYSYDSEIELLRIINDFNDINQWGITVVASYQGDNQDIFEKMIQVAGTPDTPGLLSAYQDQAAAYALSDGVIDMNALVDHPVYGLADEEESDFFQGIYKADLSPTFDNARFGFPVGRSVEVLYYNSDWLAELRRAGAVDFDGPPTTPAQFKQAACAAAANPFSAATGNKANSIGYELSIDASRFASWTFAFGGDVFDYQANQYSFDNDAAVAAMTFIQGLFNDGCARTVTRWYGDQDNFGAGITLFTVGTSAGLPFYEDVVKEGAKHHWGVAPLPHTTPTPVQNAYGVSLSIPRSTPDRELAAWLFIKYYASPEIQARWMQSSLYFPVREDAAADLTRYFDENPNHRTVFELLQYSMAEPAVIDYGSVRGLVEEAVRAIVLGADVTRTLSELTVTANERLAEQTP